MSQRGTARLRAAAGIRGFASPRSSHGPDDRDVEGRRRLTSFIPLATILIVSPSALLRKRLKDLIEPRGHTAVLSHLERGDAATAVYFHRPDGVLLDGTVDRNQDPIVFLKAIKNVRPVPVVWFGEFAHDELRAKKAGADATLAAPRTKNPEWMARWDAEIVGHLERLV